MFPLLHVTRSQEETNIFFFCNHLAYTSLAVDYDGNHPHLGWGLQNNTWATSLETEYPRKLRAAVARVCRRTLVQFGAVDLPLQMNHGCNISLTHASCAALGNQPRGKRLRPLVRDVNASAPWFANLRAFPSSKAHSLAQPH